MKYTIMDTLFNSFFRPFLLYFWKSLFCIREIKSGSHGLKTCTKVVVNNWQNRALVVNMIFFDFLSVTETKNHGGNLYNSRVICQGNH